MWALVENNQVTQVYTRPKAITIGDVSYPQNIFMLWSSDELEAIGIYEVVVDNSNFKNPSYYINTNQSFDFANDVVTASYGTATPKALEDTTDPDTGDVTHGLKWNHNQVIINQAYGLLQPNDWYVVREQEAGTAIPADWTTFRTDVRSTAADMQSKIDACTTVDELAALYEYNDATPPVRPLGEWPTPPSS
nr:N-acetylmuramidase/lysin [uncultured Mediterranean phage uvMED]